MAKEIFSSLEELLKQYPEEKIGRAKDYTNQHINRLTLLKKVSKNNVATRGAFWACKCDCGNYIVALGSQVANNHTTSCGCYNKEIAKEKGKIIGKQSNYKDYTKINNPYYDFIKPTGKTTSLGMIWDIKCKKCGKIYQEVPNQIVSDNRNRGNNPCECWKRISKGELKIEALLKNNNIIYEKEYKFSDCLSPKGNPMKFDYWVNNQYIIEYDGEQHFHSVSFGDTKKDGEEKLNLYKEYDSIKNKYCENKNIPLIRIPYTHYNDICIEDLLLNTSNFIINNKKKG